MVCRMIMTLYYLMSLMHIKMFLTKYLSSYKKKKEPRKPIVMEMTDQTDWYMLLYDPSSKEVTYAHTFSGSQGEAGVQGMIGPVGMQGDRGWPGITGMDGLQGWQGPAGTAGNTSSFTGLSVNGDFKQSNGTVNLDALNVSLLPTTVASIRGQFVTGIGSFVDAIGYPRNAWQSVAFGRASNGQYVWVAVSNTGTGNEGRVMSSTDGTSWIPRTSPVDRSWTAVAYGNGRFVAVANGGGEHPVIFSEDGETWTQGTAPEGLYRSVVYGMTNEGIGMWVAVGDSGSNMWSFDGIDWMVDYGFALNGNFTCVTYGNGLFVAVNTTEYSQRVATTSDPSTFWTYQPTSDTEAENAWQSVAYGNGIFCAVSSNGTKRVMTSPNGYAWMVLNSTALQFPWSTITFGNGLFLVMSNGSSRMMTSANGIDWTLMSDSLQSQWTSVTYGNASFVAVARSGTSLVASSLVTLSNSLCFETSVNNANVSSISSGSDNTSVVSVHGNFRVRKQDYDITWTSRTSALTRAWNSVAYGNGVYCAVSSTDASTVVMVSSNGVTWTAVDTTVDNINSSSWASVTYGNTTEYGPTFVAVASNGSVRVATSSNITNDLGKDWRASPVQPASASYNSVAYGREVFVMVGNNSVAYSNSGGTTWIQSSPAAANIWRSVAFGTLQNGTDVFVAVSSNGTNNRVMRSIDYGKTWTIQSSAANQAWVSIAYGMDMFVAVSTNGFPNQVMTSPDGIAWTLRTTPNVTAEWSSVTYSTASGGLWVALARSGTSSRCMTSVNGIVWTARTVFNNAWSSITYNPVNNLLVAVSNNTTNIAGGQVMTAPGVRMANILSSDTATNITTVSGLAIGSLGFAPVVPNTQVKIDYGRYTGTGNTGTITFRYTFSQNPIVTFGSDLINDTTMSTVQITQITTTSFSFQRLSQSNAVISQTGPSFGWMAVGI